MLISAEISAENWSQPAKQQPANKQQILISGADIQTELS
jgi:hypothetical protein